MLTLWRVAQDRRTVFCAVLVVVLLMSMTLEGADDLWWHLKAGENIVQTGKIPREDAFSFTAPGRPWIYHSWLAGIILYGVHRFAGLGGLIVLRAILMAASLMISWVAARRRGVGPGLASMLVLAACFQFQTLALTRPFLFSFVLFSITYLLLQQTLERPAPPAAASGSRFGAEKWFLWGGGGRLILLPCLAVLWANLHASFVVALLAIGAFGAAEMVSVAVQGGGRPYVRTLLSGESGARFRALLAAGVVSLGAAMITPYGPGSLLYPFRLLTEVKLTAQVLEWQAMPLTASFAVFWELMCITILALAYSAYLCGRGAGLRRNAGQFCADALLVVGFGLLAARSMRNLAWLLLLVPPVLGYHVVAARHAFLGDRTRDEADRRQGRMYVFASYTLCAVLFLYRVGGSDFGLSVSEERVPVRACDYLARAHLGDRFFNEYAWGGYLIWRFWPERRVFIDGRCDVYGDSVMGETLTVLRGQKGWEAILRKYAVDGLLIRYRSRDSRHFFRSGDWHCVYWDDMALVAVSDAARRTNPPEVEYFPLSNPAVFDDSIKDSPPQPILEEIDRVLATNPYCWTAWTFRAQCLLRMAEADEEGRKVLLQQATSAAQQAVRINSRRPETRRVLLQCREATQALRLGASPEP